MDSSPLFRASATLARIGGIAAALTLATACAKPKPPTITPKSAQVLAFGATGVTLSVAFDVANPNRFPLAVHAVDGRFALGAGAGVELGKAHAEPASSIPARGTSTVTSQVAVGWTNLAALTPFLLSPAAVPYRFDGTATLGGESLNVDLPFTLTGELTRAQLINAGLSGLSQPAGL
jgi:LEA14-like dessication related protein